MTTAERVIHVLNESGYTMTEFAKKLRVSQPYISKLKNNPNSVPSDGFINNLCREFGIREEWIVKGEGDIFIPMTKEEEISKFFAEVQCDNGIKKKFISILSELGEDDWALIENFAEKLAKSDK